MTSLILIMLFIMLAVCIVFMGYALLGFMKGGITIIHKYEYPEEAVHNTESIDPYDDEGNLKEESKDVRATIDDVLTKINKIMVGDDVIAEDSDEK